MQHVWLFVRWLHILAMAFFVGGQLFMAAVVVPAERAVPDRERLRAIARNFGYGTLVAIGVLLMTGMAMASHYRRWSDPLLHAKLGVFVLVGALILWHLKKPASHVLDAIIFIGSLVIVWLGLAIVHTF